MATNQRKQLERYDLLDVLDFREMDATTFAESAHIDPKRLKRLIAGNSTWLPNELAHVMSLALVTERVLVAGPRPRTSGSSRVRLTERRLADDFIEEIRLLRERGRSRGMSMLPYVGGVNQHCCNLTASNADESWTRWIESMQIGHAAEMTLRRIWFFLSAASVQLPIDYETLSAKGVLQIADGITTANADERFQAVRDLPLSVLRARYPWPVHHVARHIA